jgi:multidrug efflux pump subunit AcrA (membrane-fusion protein)
MATASWDQLERSIERLHDAARSPVDEAAFYRQLIDEAAAAIDAAGGAVWRAGAGERPQLVCESLPAGIAANRSARAAMADRLLSGGAADIASHDSAHDVLYAPVEQPAAGDDAAKSNAGAVIELWMPAGADAGDRQAWLDFAAALADVAADFHARDELRRLRSASRVHDRALDLVSRASTPRTLAGAAFEVVNEARRALDCDRVSLIIRRSGRWRLVAASGADEAPRRTEFARRSEALAEYVATWGAAVEAPVADATASDRPPQLAGVIEAHLDHSQARRLAAAPIRLAERPGNESAPAQSTCDAVLVAERFRAGETLQAALVELGDLCAPALARARTLERFPVGLALRWSERLARLREPARLSRTLIAAILVACGLAALAYWPVEFHVEAPARLAAAVERDVFAAESGTVAEIHVEHGQHVDQGETLVVLHDPELALLLQENRGEIDAARKRLDALAVSRTDRKLREGGEEGRLPLAAEQRELEQRLASLERQREVLDARRESLDLRSPCAGTVITRDVQTLLASRPVERGQALLTIADADSGWELRADVSQRQIGHVIAAQKALDDPLPATYRLAGDVEATYQGHVVAMSAAAPLDASGLQDDAAPVEVRIAVDGESPAAARSGMSASVRIHCGQKTLGYVWLHDVGVTLYRWATF